MVAKQPIPPGPPPAEIEAKLQMAVEAFLAELHRGTRPNRATVTAAAPELAPWLDERLKLVEIVYLAAKEPARQARQVPPWEREKAKRFCCPHCGNQIQLVETTAEREITCENCGSSFEVSQPSTVSFRPADGAEKIGRFELREPLGRGAFGFVYKAFDPELRRFVAIKVPRTGYFPSQEDEERFLREARAAAQLTHPGIVRVHEISRHSGLPYLVSDYVEGVTLADRLSSGRLGFRDAAELLAELADAAEYAHRHHVIHRDLKPSNVLLDLRGRPVITDFGLARNAEAEITVTLDGQVLGTPAYMSPEQARGEANRVDTRSDIYSLGVILYESLAGELPFRGNRRMLLNQVLHDEPRGPRRINDRIPRDLETICLKAMAKSPARRYATAADLADDLRRWLDRKPIRARPVGRIERTWSWCRRNPLPAGLAAAVAAALVSGTIVSMHFAARAVAKAADEARERGRADGKAADEALQRQRADAKAAEARRNLYISDMHLAEQYWKDGQTGPAIELLARYVAKPGEKDLRGWEWYYQQRLCHQELRTLKGHEKRVDAIAFSPDGTRLATAGEDGAKLWDVATGREIHSLQKETATCLAFSPDGLTLATADLRRGVSLWDVARGARRSRITDGTDWTQRLAFTPDGKNVAAVGQAGTVALWDVTSLTMQRSFSVSADALFFAKYSSVRSAFTNDVTRLANVALMSGAALWDVATGMRLSELQNTVPPFRVFTPEGNGGRRDTKVDRGAAVSYLAFTPDGKRLATCMVGESLRLYDGITGHIERTLPGPTEDASCLAFSPDGARLVLGGGHGTIRVWDVADGAVLRTFSGHTAGVTCLGFNPDGSQMASADETGTVRIWDTSAGAFRPIVRSQERFISTVVEDDFGIQGIGRVGHGAYDSRLDPRDVTEGQAIRTFSCLYNDQERVAFSPDGKSVGVLPRWPSVYEPATVWDLATAHEQMRISFRLREDRYPAWLTFAFDSSGRWLAALNRERGVALLDLSTGVDSPILDGERFAMEATASCDGRTVALATVDGNVIVVDTRTRTRIFSAPATARNLSLSADGALLAATLGEGDETDEDFGEEVVLWSVSNSGNPRRIQGLRSVFRRLAISPDGGALAVASREGLNLIDVETGEIRRELRGHDGSVMALAFSRDGKRLASGGWDHTVKLWDVATGQEVRTLRGHAGMVTDVAFSHDGYLLASASQDGTVRVYDALPWADELACEREACAVAEFLLQRATSLTDLIERIKERSNIANAVRQQALVFAPKYWPAEARIRAGEAVNQLVERLLLKADVIDRLRQDAALDDDVRSEALRQAEARDDDTNRLNAASWAIVVRRDAGDDDYQRALRWMDAACKILPDNGNLLNTLGVAQFRMGQFDNALATLTRSLDLNTKDGSPHPSDVAFLALVHHALGHADEAQALLEKLRELAKQSQWQDDAEAQGFFREAEDRIVGQPDAAPKAPE